MFTYFLQRLGQTVPVLLAVLLLTFGLMQLAPGSIVEASLDQRATEQARAALRERLGLDRPAWRQLAGYLVLDFGMSQRQDVPARTLVLQRFGNTMKLAVAAMVLAVGVGVGVGILAAVTRGSWIDRLAMVAALVGISTPVFWLGMILLAAAARLGWPWLTDDGSGHLAFLLLPAVTLGASSVAVITRMTRAALLEVLDADYLRTARAKGLGPARVVLRHALRNALIPVVTVVGLDFASYLTGAVLTESVFNYPGLGRTLIEAITDRNLPVVLCGVTLITLTFILVNLAVDLLYAAIDPRIRFAARATE